MFALGIYIIFCSVLLSLPLFLVWLHWSMCTLVHFLECFKMKYMDKDVQSSFVLMKADYVMPFLITEGYSFLVHSDFAVFL